MPPRDRRKINDQLEAAKKQSRDKAITAGDRGRKPTDHTRPKQPDRAPAATMRIPEVVIRGRAGTDADGRPFKKNDQAGKPTNGDRTPKPKDTKRLTDAQKEAAVRKAFVEKLRSFAKDDEKKSGVPWLMTMGQAALESNWGRNAYGDNYFGVKASRSAPLEKRQLLKTHEHHNRPDLKDLYPEGCFSVTPMKDGRFDYHVRAWFRKYNSPEESFRDHGKVLRQKIFAKAFDHKDDPYKFAHEIAMTGKYATAPPAVYARDLAAHMRTIEKLAAEVGE